MNDPSSPLLYNCDFGGMFWNPEMWRGDDGRYTAAAIHRFVDNLADHGVDGLVVNANTKVAWYPSRVVPTAWQGYRRGDETFFAARNPDCTWYSREFLDPYMDLVEAGVDWLHEAIAACRRRGLGVVISVRMNDPHNSADLRDPLNPPELADCRLGNQAAYPEMRYMTGTYGLDYSRAEVRGYMLRMIRELVEDYDADGLQLDWLRVPSACPPGADEAMIATMTAWHGEVRALVEAQARQTGRPPRLGLRVPGNHRMLRHIGLDVAAWGRAGWLDFLCVSNFMQTSWDMPHDRLREEFGPDVTIHGVTELTFNFLWARRQGGPTDRFTCAHRPGLRANVAGKLVLGAQGIEVFNFFVADLTRRFSQLAVGRTLRDASDYPALRDLTNLDKLRGEEKHYAFTVAGRYCWAPPFDRPEPLPVVLAPQDRREFRLPMCAEPAGDDLELAVQVVVERGEGPFDVGVSFNGDWPRFDGRPDDGLFFPSVEHKKHVPEHQGFVFTLDVAEIREGWNEITVCNGAPEDGTPAAEARARTFRVVSVELAVRRRAPAG